MRFFIPNVTDNTQAEAIYQAIQTFIQAPPQKQRIQRIEWMHEGIHCQTQVGEKLPNLFHTQDVTLAIFDCDDDLVKICSPTRGTMHTPPIYVDKLSISAMSYFEDTQTLASK